MSVGDARLAPALTLGRRLETPLDECRALCADRLALAAACLWGPHAQALGLGRLTVQSALGETLRAEIDVTSLTPEEAASLKLRVAPPEAYRAAGVEYNPVLPGRRCSWCTAPTAAPCCA